MRSMYDVKAEDFEPEDTMDDLAVRAMDNCWQQIAGDCLVDDEGNADESMTLSRADVLDLILDGDRLAYVNGGTDEDINIAGYVIAMKWYYPEHWWKLSRKAFPYDDYGY